MTASLTCAFLQPCPFQLFRKDDAELCRQMKFTPAAPEKDDTASAAATTTTAATQETPSTATKGGDSHSILRVPSLAAPSDRAKDFSGRSNWRMPAVVNYHDEPQPASWPIRSRGMPPYSPIRIRSGRGGTGRVSSRRGGASFPVSNRGRRVAVHPRAPEDDEEEEPPLKMLEKLQGETSTEALSDTLQMLQKQDSSKEPAEKPAAKTEAVPESPPRSVLKRRLPMTREVVQENDGDDKEEIKPSASNASTESGTTSGSVAV